MSFFSVDVSIPPLPPVHLPPVPEVIDVPADLPALDPDVVISFPLNEQLMDMVVVPDEHDGQDVIYVAVSQERVNIWAAVVYFNPEITLGVMVLVVLVALRKLWVTRRFTHRKGEPYCKKCWAGLTGVVSDNCPECGRAIKKTRRTAKWSKRSPGHARWRWALTAFVVVLYTTTVWFSESWGDLGQHGFSRREPSDWLALVGPLDAESPLRLNDVGGWCAWYWAAPAEFGRERDQRWIRLLASEYTDDLGTKERWLLRRYTTDSGRMLSQSSVPWDIPQDHPRLVYPSPRLACLNGIVLLYNDMHTYRYRHDMDRSWVSIGTHDAEVLHTDIAVTPDAQYIVVIQRVDRSGSYRDLRVSVWDAESAAFVSQLYTIFATRRTAALWPEMRQVQGLGPGHFEVEYPAEAVVPLDDGALLFDGFDAHAVWRFDEATFMRLEHRDLDAQMTRDDLCTKARNRFGAYMTIGGRRLTSFQWQRLGPAARHQGQEWLVHPWLDDRIGQPQGLHMHDTFWDRYDESTDVPLYATAQLPEIKMPSRVLRIDRQSRNERVWVSPAGRWLAVAEDQWRSQSIPLLIDIQRVVAAGSLSGGISSSLKHLVFVNDGEQVLVASHDNPIFNRIQTVYLRDEIHLYNLPAVDEQ